MTSNQEIFSIATMLIGAAGGGFAAAYKWMTGQINAAKVELKAEFDADINELKKRVAVLEHGQAEARAMMLEAYTLAVQSGCSDIAEKLLQAERALR